MAVRRPVQSAARSRPFSLVQLGFVLATAIGMPLLVSGLILRFGSKKRGKTLEPYSDSEKAQGLALIAIGACVLGLLLLVVAAFLIAPCVRLIDCGNTDSPVRAASFSETAPRASAPTPASAAAAAVGNTAKKKRHPNDAPFLTNEEFPPWARKMSKRAAFGTSVPRFKRAKTPEQITVVLHVMREAFAVGDVVLPHDARAQVAAIAQEKRAALGDQWAGELVVSFGHVMRILRDREDGGNAAAAPSHVAIAMPRGPGAAGALGGDAALADVTVDAEDPVPIGAGSSLAESAHSEESAV